MFIKHFEGVLSPELCSELIERFNTSTEVESFNNNLRPKFHQITITDRDLQNKLALTTLELLTTYRKMVGWFMPEPTMMEQFRVKRYEADTDDQFATHVDSTSLESSTRFVAALFYLNDDYSEGETEFFFGNESIKVKPVTGSVVVFPPFWCYPHRGLPAKGKDKYIMSTYGRYD